MTSDPPMVTGSGALSIISEVADSCRRWARELGAADPFRLLAADADSARAPLRVALLGQQPQKAAIINDFLGANALWPYRGLGRTRIITFDEIDGLRFTDSGARRQLTDIGWASIDSSVGESGVEVRSSAAILRDLMLELVDIYPTRTLRPSRQGWADLQACQYVIMIVEASSMITRTELDILREINVRNGPALLAVIITGMEHVDPAEHSDVVRMIQNGLQRYTLAVPLLTVPPGERGGGMLRSVLTDDRVQARVRAGRDWTMLTGLILTIQDLLGMVGQRRAAAELSVAQRQRQRTENESEAAEWRRNWSVIRLALRAKSAEFGDRLRKTVDSGARKLSATLLSGYQEEADPAWLDAELPYSLHAGMVDIACECEQLFMAHAGRQLDLLREAKVDFGQAWSAALGEPVSAVLPPSSVLPLRKPDQIRLLTALGSTATSFLPSVLTSCFHVPVPDPGVAIKPLLDSWIAHADRDAKAAVKEFINQAVFRVSDEFTKGAVDTVREFTTMLLAEGERARIRLTAAQDEALNSAAPEDLSRLSSVEAGLTASLATLRSLT